MFKKFRILEINNIFIPQVRKNLFMWYGIEEFNLDTWNDLEYQIEYCDHCSIEDAKETINNYININKSKYHNIKYHSIDV